MVKMAYFRAYKKYFKIKGRSTKSEFWLFYLINSIFMILLYFAFDYLIRNDILKIKTKYALLYKDFRFEFYMIPAIILLAFLVLTFIPSFTVFIRRLHDSERTGWFILLLFVPVIGWLWIISLLFADGTFGSNAFGNDPRNKSEESLMLE